MPEVARLSAAFGNALGQGLVDAASGPGYSAEEMAGDYKRESNRFAAAVARTSSVELSPDPLSPVYGRTFAEDTTIRQAPSDPYGLQSRSGVAVSAGPLEFNPDQAMHRWEETGAMPVYDFGNPLEIGGDVGDQFAGGSVRVMRGSGIARPGGIEVLDPVPSTVNGVSVNRRADGLIQAASDLAGAGELYRDIKLLGALMSDMEQQSTIDKLKATLQGKLGMMRVLPSESDLGATQGFGTDGVARWDKADLIDRYGDALRKVELMKQGVIELDTRTMMIKSIGSDRLSPDQWAAENTRRYQAGYGDGLAEGQRRYEARRLPFALDMPRDLQIGLYADGAARDAVIRYNRSIGVPEGPGQLLSMNRWSYDPSGSGEYNRIDLLMDLGPSRNNGALILRTAVEGKASIDAALSSRGQLQRAYEWVTPRVIVVTPRTALPWTPSTRWGK